MNILKRIEEIREEKGWSMYKLAEMSGLTTKCIYNWYGRNTIPTIDTLTKVCDAFGMSLAQFFAEDDNVVFDKELKEIYDDWIFLTAEQKKAVKVMVKSMKG